MNTEAWSIESWHFILRVNISMVIQTKMVDETLESAIRKEDNQIKRNHLRPVMNRLMNSACYNSWWGVANERERNPLKNKPLYQILKAVTNDDL